MNKGVAFALVALALTTGVRAQESGKGKKSAAGKAGEMLRQVAKEAFSKADLDKDGSLNKEEFGKAMASFGQKLAEARGGQVKQKAAKSKSQNRDEKNPEAARIDAKKAEAKAAAIDRVFAVADADHDGRVSEREFVAFMEQQARQMLQRRREGGARSEKGKSESKADSAKSAGAG